jgi:hypothetical protein
MHDNRMEASRYQIFFALLSFNHVFSRNKTISFFFSRLWAAKSGEKFFVQECASIFDGKIGTLSKLILCMLTHTHSVIPEIEAWNENFIEKKTWKILSVFYFVFVYHFFS